MLLSTFMMIHRHEHIYSIHLSMLSSGTCFQLSMPLCLLCCFTSIWYTYLCSLPRWLRCFPVYEKYIPFTFWESVALVLNAHEIHQRYILFIYLFSIIYDLLYKLYPNFYIKSGYFLSLFYLYSKNHQICTMNLL